jgi:cytoplasmic tRNA 2-thiolation protein 1
MARLTPDKGQGPSSCDDNAGIGGCGSADGRTSGSEMAQMEAKLKSQQKTAPGLETEIMSNGKSASEDMVKLPIRPKRTPVKTPVKETTSTSLQTLGQCVKCGYMSSQSICHACTLLETLNKNRPEIGTAV